MTERFGLLARTASGTGVLHQLTSVIARHAGDIASVEILGTRDCETSIYFEIERPSESDALFAELRALPIGKIDGTAAFDRNHGFIFLFNPDPRRLSAQIALDASVGLTTGSRFAVREVQPQSGRYIATQSRTFWRRGAHSMSRSTVRRRWCSRCWLRHAQSSRRSCLERWAQRA